VDARLNLDLARGLIAGVKANTPVTGGAGEPECRCAAGRAYYAAYLTARRFLRDVGLRLPPTSSSHSVVQFALANAGVDLLVRVSSELRELYQARAAADYDLADPAPEQVSAADMAVGRAEFVLLALDLIAAGRVNPPVDTAAVADAVLAWAKANGQDPKIRRA
jgi:hypothetical protein